MATELASGYISLTVRYADSMKQLNRDFTKVAQTANQSGTKAGQAFSQGMQRQTRNISQNMGFGQVTGKATTAGRQAGGAFSTGFLSGTKGLSTKVSQSVQQVASPKQMQSSGSTAGAGFMAGLAGGMLKGGAVGLVTTAIAGIGTAVTLGMGRLTAIDDAKAMLTGLGHSAETVTKIMDNATAAVKGTAFGLGEIATFAATAIAAGVKPGADLESYLTRLADAAAIAKAPLSEIAPIFNSIQAQGKATTEDLQQLEGRGLPVFQQLADRFHVTQEELRKMVSEGKVSAADFNASIQENIGGAAKKMGESVSGGFANVKTAIARFGAALLEPLFKQLPGLFSKLTPMIDNITKALGPAFASIAAQIGPALTQLGQLFNTHLLPAIKEVWANIKGPLAEAFATAKAAFIEALPIFKAVAVVIGVALVAGVKAAGVVWPIMIRSLTQAMNVFKAFATVVTGAWDLVSGAFTTGWDIISGVFEKMKAGFNAVKDFISTVFTGVKTAVEAAFKGIVEVIKEPLRAVGRMIQGIPVIDLPLGGSIDVTGFGDKLAGLRKGGVVKGKGTGTSDSILAMLSAGEGVVTAKGMARGGAPLVAALNAGWAPSAAMMHAMLPGFKKGGTVSQDEMDRMGGGSINLSILQWLRSVNPAAELNSAKTDHDADGGEHPKGKAIDVDPSTTNLNALWGIRDKLSMIIYDHPTKVWYNMNGERAEGADARAIYGASTMAGHGDHIHVAALSAVSGGGGVKVTGPSLDQLTNASTEEEIAHAILAEAQRRGYSMEEAKAILATAIGESGLDPNVVNEIGRTGLFQQDESYPGRQTAGGQITGFFDRLAQTATGGGGGGGGDIYSRITKGVQKGGYGKDWIQRFEGQASDFAATMGDVADTGDEALEEAQDVASSSDNPYVRLIEAIKDILPDFGQMADIGVGGVKETLLPPGFSDPTQWGAVKAASGLMGFFSGLTNDPVAKGILGIGSAALGGSGSGVVSAIEGMIPAPFGSATPVAVGPNVGQPAPFGALGAPPGAPAVGGQLGGPAVDNSVHIGQVNDDANKVLDKTKRQQNAAQWIHLGSRRFV